MASNTSIDCPQPCKCEFGSTNSTEATCSGKQLKSFPWKLPATTTILCVYYKVIHLSQINSNKKQKNNKQTRTTTSELTREDTIHDVSSKKYLKTVKQLINQLPNKPRSNDEKMNRLFLWIN